MTVGSRSRKNRRVVVVPTGRTTSVNVAWPKGSSVRRCEICGKPVTKRVRIKNGRKDYRYTDCVRCDLHVECAVRSYGADGVEIKPIEDASNDGPA